MLCCDLVVVADDDGEVELAAREGLAVVARPRAIRYRRRGALGRARRSACMRY